MESLRGMRVALLEARMGGELEGLVRRWGGEPYRVAAVVERPRDARAEVAAAIDALAPGDVVVLQTGAGATAVLDAAGALGREAELVAKLRAATVVCRGPKPAAVAKRLDVPAIRVDEPHTTRELLAALGALDLRGRHAIVVHYGERNAPLVAALAEAGARVRELLVYEWALPEDRAPLVRLVEELVERRVGAIAFTSQVQVRHLFAVAREKNLHAELARAMVAGIVVAAIGPTCARALEHEGVRAHVVPEHPKMGALVAALTRHVVA